MDTNIIIFSIFIGFCLGNIFQIVLDHYFKNDTENDTENKTHKA